MLKVEEFLKTIPVYPDSIKIKGVTTLPSYIGLCEDEKCNISWISNEAKEEGLRDFNEAKTTHNAPKKNTGQIYRVWKVPNTPRVGRRVRDQLSYPQFQDSTIWDESGGSVDKA